MNFASYARGARLSAPGLKDNVTVIVPADAPMGRALRRLRDRQHRRELARLASEDARKAKLREGER